MKRFIVILISTVSIVNLVTRCANEGLSANSSDTLSQSTITIAQTSGQLASGTTFTIAGSETDSTPGPGRHHSSGDGRGHNPHDGILDGLSLLAPTDELLAIVDAESAGDIRGMRISKNGGASITNYDADGNVITFPMPADGPHGCSFSGHQFPSMDSLLSTIVKTEINFGSGVTFKRDTVEITRAGKIVIERKKENNSITEVITFESYSVNGTSIEGTKTRVSTFDSATGSGSSTTKVTNGKIIFADGTVSTWTSDKSRISSITLDETTGRPSSGTITTEVSTSVTALDGTVIYSHKTADPLIEDIACEGRRHGPLSGTLETIYRDNTILVDYGNGSCTNRTITITVNGVTTTKTIGG